MEEKKVKAPSVTQEELTQTKKEEVPMEAKKAPSVTAQPKDDGEALLKAALTYKPNHRSGDSDSAYALFKANVIAIFKAATDKKVPMLTVGGIVGALKDKPYFVNVDKEDRYRRAYNYLNNLKGKAGVVPAGWVFVSKDKAANGKAHFVNKNASK
jgi:hypothetical protein